LGKLADFTVTVASARIDCVISALCGVSRSKAAELIEGGFVSLNSIMCDKTTRTVRNSDKVTVRGKGKFIIDNLNDLSKKGRIILKYKKYI
jgi:RNA-binding protein YlmH